MTSRHLMARWTISKIAFQSGETVSELISDFYGHHQKRTELEDAFADDLQVLVRKIIGQKPSFRAKANEQLKHQYAHKLHDQFYAAIAHSMLQTSDPMETFTQFCGRLALTFGSCSRSGKISSQAAAIETTASTISEVSCKSLSCWRIPDRGRIKLTSRQPRSVAWRPKTRN